MNKFTLIGAMLLLLTSAVAFAQAPAVELNPELSAEATLKFVFDLNDPLNFDIVNEVEADILLELLKSDSAETGSGNLIGWIKISDLNIKLGTHEDHIYDIDLTDDVEDTHPLLFAEFPSVQARVYLLGPPLYIEITDVNPEIDLGVFEDFSVLKDDLKDEWTHPEGVSHTTDDDGYYTQMVDDVSLAQDDENDGSFTIGTENAIVNATLTFTEDEHTTPLDGGVEKNSFNLYLGAELVAVENLDLDFGFFFDPYMDFGVAGDVSRLGVGLAAAYTIPIGSNSIGIGLSYELGSTNGEIVGASNIASLNSELNAKLNFAFLGMTLDYFFGMNLGKSSTVTIDNVETKTTYTTPIDMVVKFSTGDLLPILTLGLTADISILGGYSETVGNDAEVNYYADGASHMGLEATLDFNLLEKIKPRVKYGLLRRAQLFGENEAPGMIHGLEVGVALENVIDNVTFDLMYDNNFYDPDTTGSVGAQDYGSGPSGVVTFATTISF